MSNIDAEQLQADLRAQFGAGFYQPEISVPTAEQRDAFFKAQEEAATPTKTPTKTPAEILAEQNAARLEEVLGAADVAGGFVGGTLQDEVDALREGVRTGIYSADDALGRLRQIEQFGRSQISGGGDDDATDTTDVVDENAWAKLKSYLSDYGLSNIEGMLTDLMAKGITDSTAVLFELRNTPEFKKRFAANEARRAEGLPMLTPASYVEMENTYREVLRRGGMLEYFNSQDVFEKLLAGDVSPAELYDRMTNAYNVVAEADAGTKAQMSELYGVEGKDLAAYFLDPKTSVSVLKRRAEAAKIAAAGKEQGGMQLTSVGAEDLASRGYTAAQAATAFGGLTQQAGLYQEMTGEQAFTEQERLGAAFGYDPLASQKLEQRKQRRLAEFRGGGQFARTTGATSGTIETGLGTAQ
jgi:hypothetical protein